MAIRSLSTASISTGSKRSKFWDQSTILNSFESIATALTTGSTSEIVLSSIPSTFTHLQIRVTCQQSSADNILIQFNGDTASNYYWHELFGDGVNPASGESPGAVNHIKFAYTHGGGSTYYTGASVGTIINYSSTTQKKTFNAFTGSNKDASGSGYVLNRSGHWTSTDAISSIRLFPASGNLSAGTRVAIYGIRG